MEFDIQMALDKGISVAEVLSDSQTTIRALGAMDRPPVWSLTGVFYHILEANKLFSVLELFWILWELNENAHNLYVWARNNLDLNTMVS